MFPINRDPPATDDNAEEGVPSTNEKIDWTPGCAVFFVFVLAFSSLLLIVWVWERMATPSPDGISEKRWMDLGLTLVPFLVSLVGTILCVKQLRRETSGDLARKGISMSTSVPVWPGCLVIVLFFFVTSWLSLAHRFQSERIQPIQLTEITTATYRAEHRFQLQNVVLLSPRKTEPEASGIFEDVAPIITQGAQGGPYLVCAAYDRFRKPPVGTIAYVNRTKGDQAQIARSLGIGRYPWQYVGDFIPDPVQREDKETMSLWSAIGALILSLLGFVAVGFQIKEAFTKKT